MKTLYIVVWAALSMLAACGRENKPSVETSAEVEDVSANETSVNETVTSGGVSEEDPASETTETENIPAQAEETPASSEYTSVGLTEVQVPEFDGIDVKLYEAEDSSIYSIEKSLLFTTGSAGLRAEADQSLRKISTSISERYKDGQIVIYGYIDPSENPNYKRDVAERRVQAVKEWLQEKGALNEKQIAVQPVVEIDPSSAAETKKDQRIEIVVRNLSS